MYTLIIRDLQGGGMGENAVNRRFVSSSTALQFLRDWECSVGRHLPIQYSGYQYCWDVYDPKGRRLTDFI
jgi:hypothetical protein